MDTSDTQLLDAWRHSRDREAMDQLIRRHIDFVYGAARRILRDSIWAEDVTQAVFMLLIHKSPRLPTDPAIAVWLHRTTRYACANARKMQSRRVQRDSRNAIPETTRMESEVDRIDDADERERLIPLLDEAIGQLGERDRSGLILCYFQRRTFREIGAMLGTTEEAARKRVTRSVDRIREYFLSHGAISGASSAAIVATCFSEQATWVAPSALVTAATNFATLSHIATFGIPSAQIAQKVMHTMLVSKMKLAAAACAAIVTTTAVTATAIQQFNLPAVGPAIVASSSVMVAAADAFEAKVGDETTVQFLGVTKRGATGNEWFGIDGSKIDDPRGPFARNEFRTDPKMTYQAMLHIAGKDLDGGYSVRVSGGESTLYDLTPDKDSAFILVPFNPKDRATVDIDVLIADGDWKIIGTGQNEPGRGIGDFETDYGSIALTHLMDLPGRGSMLYVAHSVEGPQLEITAVDAQGVEHRCTNINTSDFKKFHTMCLEYNLQPDAVVSVNVKVRPFNRKVTAKDVTLDSTKPTKPQVTVKDIADGK